MDWTNSPIQGQSEKVTIYHKAPSLCSREMMDTIMALSSRIMLKPGHITIIALLIAERGIAFILPIFINDFPFHKGIFNFLGVWVISEEAKPQLLLGGELCPSHILCWSRNSQHFRVRPFGGTSSIRVKTLTFPRQGAGVDPLVRDLDPTCRN